jgi:MFS family permease
MVEGLRYLKGEKLILVVVVFSLFHVISGQPFNQLLPVFTESVLQVSATKLGILTSVSSVGALTISLVMASVPNKKRGLLLLLSGVIMGTALVVFSFSAWWYLALMLMPFIGMGPTLHSTLTATIVQTYVEPNYRGRMQSFVTMSTGLASFGTFLAGVLSEAVGIQWAIGGMAVFLAVISLMIIVLYPPLRKMD